MPLLLCDDDNQENGIIDNQTTKVQGYTTCSRIGHAEARLDGLAAVVKDAQKETE